MVEYYNKQVFCRRLAELRMSRNISARQMSLDLGQSISYINKIENNKALPSMEVFFNICQYLDVEPGAFFATGDADHELRFIIDYMDTLEQNKRIRLLTVLEALLGWLDSMTHQ